MALFPPILWFAAGILSVLVQIAVVWVVDSLRGTVASDLWLTLFLLSSFDWFNDDDFCCGVSVVL
jgi:hypothetical protein